AREHTKTYHTRHGTPLGELIEWVKSADNPQRGEMVLLLHGHRETSDESLPDEDLRTLGILTKELPVMKAAALVEEITP
ncbi:rRNA (cytidine-2'-O-)-methyltransferase, partial [Vibrio parahaemolyticus]|nr:rRNA (cytidine-2'-O-)-methyltransferase [Vibrio parahaemolyticus]